MFLFLPVVRGLKLLSVELEFDSRNSWMAARAF